jgi:tRNA (cmo5U34)-methyltransferase
MTQFHFDPATYLDMIRAELGRYDDLQEAVATATQDSNPERILDLGTGTGETARRVLDLHPHARLVGIDVSEQMLAVARGTLPRDRAELRVAKLEDPLPSGPFQLVVSALAVHHLPPEGKRDLFARIAVELSDDGIFVMGDVVIPELPEDAVAPLTPDFDMPDRVDDQLLWMGEAGFAAEVVWSWKDLAVVRAVNRG